MTRVLFPSTPQGGQPPINQPTVPGQPSPNLPSVSVQPPATIPVSNRQYPNIDRKWFSSDSAHAGVSLAFRNIFDIAYDSQDAIQMLVRSNPGVQLSNQTLLGSGAVNPSQRANYLINATTTASLTLGAPRPGMDDGTIIQFSSSGTSPHTLTTPGLLQTGSAAINTATWPSSAGGSLALMAWNGKWQVVNSNQITFS